MKIHFLLPLLLFFGGTAHSVAQTEIAPYEPGVTLEGVNYFLPQTALHIILEAERTDIQPGELYKYAFRYLRLRDVPKERQTRWKIKNISVQPYGVPDKSKAYNIHLKKRTLAPLVSLTNDGILLSINTKQDEQPLTTTPKNQTENMPPDPRRYMSQEMLVAGSTAKLAELCAQEIYGLRENRKELIAGQAENAPKDGAQLKLMLDQLDEQASALEQLFYGTKRTSTQYFSFFYIPQTRGEREVLLRFSELEGPLTSDNLLGSPIYIQLTDLEQLPTAVPNAEVSKKKEKMEQGVWYNVPARHNVRLFNIERTFVDTDIAFGQFGHTEVLSNVLFDKKTTTRVIFSQTNGAVLKIEQ